MLSWQPKNNYRKVMEQLEVRHQQCLDQGEAMMLCSRHYSIQMDSMLNVVYQDLLGHYNPQQQKQLRFQQREWLKKRDVKLKTIWADVNALRAKGEFVPQDDRMFAYGKEATLVEERVLELISELEKVE